MTLQWNLNQEGVYSLDKNARQKIIITAWTYIVYGKLFTNTSRAKLRNKNSCTKIEKQKGTSLMDQAKSCTKIGIYIPNKIT